MKFDFDKSVALAVAPTASTVVVRFQYVDGQYLLVYSAPGDALGQTDMQDASVDPALQAALDNYIKSRLGTKLSVTVTKSLALAQP